MAFSQPSEDSQQALIIFHFASLDMGILELEAPASVMVRVCIRTLGRNWLTFFGRKLILWRMWSGSRCCLGRAICVHVQGTFKTTSPFNTTSSFNTTSVALVMIG